LRSPPLVNDSTASKSVNAPARKTTFLKGWISPPIEMYLRGEEVLRLGSHALRVARVDNVEPAELPYVASCGYTKFPVAGT
jgi:hypothetical protein